jgi:hypothetical protein
MLNRIILPRKSGKQFTMKLRLALMVWLSMVQVVASKAQSDNALLLQFNPVFGSNALATDQTYISNNDSLQISTLRFYISGIEFLMNEERVWKEENSFHLIDATLAGSLNIALNKPQELNYNRLKFNIGIDSTTNIAGVMGGDLDPTKGMYWTWQSGYINFKLEGNSKRCNTRNHEFTFHLGGYQYPYNTLQTLILPIGNAGRIDIIIDAAKLIAETELSKQNHIMSPGEEAMALSGKLKNAFSISVK